MKTAFDKSFQKLLKEPEFKRLKRSYTNHSMFHFSKLEEKHTTELINWLLNPREAHGSHIFFKFFLTAVSTALNETDIKHKAYFLKQVKKLQTSKRARKNYIFKTEQKMNGNDRCDIVGVSLDKSVSIFIENKVESPLSGNQLDRYRDFADANSQSKKPLLILMDARSERNLIGQANTDSQRWLLIGYDWIGDSIEEYLSAPAPQNVEVILKSFQTELEMYMSTELNQKNTFWSDAYKDIGTLGRNYHALFQDEEYLDLTTLTLHEYARAHKKNPKVMEARLKYPEIFGDLEDFGVFNTFEWSENSNPGFNYETDIKSKNAYFFPGDLQLVKDRWPVMIKLNQQNIETNNGVGPEMTVYNLSLAFISKKFENGYTKRIRKHFSKEKTYDYSFKNLSLIEAREHLFESLTKLKIEISVFNKNST